MKYQSQHHFADIQYCSYKSFSFKYDALLATKYISYKSLHHSILQEKKRFQFYGFQKPQHMEKITELERSKVLQPLFSTIFPPSGSRDLLFKQIKSPTETPLNFLASRTYEKRVQSTSKISQTVHFFSKSFTSLVNGDLLEKTHVVHFISSSQFARSSLQKIVAQKVTEIRFG